jgi:hypothetical protein
MASCAVCGTGLREGATHCTTCGTPTGVAPAAVPANSSSPFVSETSWIDSSSPFGSEASWESASPALPALPAASAYRSAAAPHRSRPVKVIVIAALVAAVVALAAVVAVPRLFPQVDPQKYVGAWAYTGNAAAKVVITRQGSSFTIVFVAQNGTRQSLPGMISDKKLMIDYAALGPQGKIVKKLAESIGAKLSFSYRKSDDRLLLTGSNPSQGSFTLVMERSSSS